MPHTPDSHQASLALRSEEVQEIMSYIPHWIIRWGITVICLTVMGLLFLAWLIQYSEIVTGQLTLTSVPPPLRLVAPSSGELAYLFVAENDTVAQHAPLVVISNPAETDDILWLQAQLPALTAFLSGDTAAPPDLNNRPSPRLGEVQASYAALVSSLENRHFFAGSGVFRQGQIQSLQAQIQELDHLNQSLLRQQALQEQELELARKEQNINTQLFEKGVISRVEKEKGEVVFLQKKMELERMSANVYSQNIQLAEYQKRIREMQQGTRKSQQDLNLEIKANFKRLLSSLDQWQQRYLIRAPASGRVSFFDVWAPQQYVKAGTELMSLIPAATRLIGKVQVPVQGSGLIRIGQAVNLKLHHYDPQVYGMLEAEVRRISPVAKGQAYTVDLVLKQGLTTTYGRSLDFQAEMTGTAEIITEERRLLARVFGKLQEVIEGAF